MITTAINDTTVLKFSVVVIKAVSQPINGSFHLTVVSTGVLILTRSLYHIKFDINLIKKFLARDKYEISLLELISSILRSKDITWQAPKVISTVVCSRQ